MFYYTYVTAPIFVIGLWYTSEITNMCISTGSNVKQSIINSYQTYKQLKRYSNVLVNSPVKISKYKLILHLVKSLWIIGFFHIVQVVNRSVTQLDDDTYEVRFCIRNKLYKMVIHPSTSPDKVLQIVDSNGDDVTDKVKPYMGPNYNWYGDNPPYNVLNSDTFSIIDDDGEETIIGYNNINTDNNDSTDLLIEEISTIRTNLTDCVEEENIKKRIDIDE